MSVGEAAGGGAPGSKRSWSADEERSLRLWIALARCYATVSRDVATRIADYGLTAPQFGILEALYHLGPLSLGDLAGKLLVTGGNITYVMDRLESQGLVSRDRSGPDRRVVMACLTDEGAELIRDVFPGHAAFVHELTEGLTTEEQDRLRALLKKWGRSLAEPGPES
ncbi:MAG TPA: MarR family transcriptional regulator [Longimicrobiales bacterium]|nr:MarR family transcriptional regulator [Longimicrobiales bacterium]